MEAKIKEPTPERESRGDAFKRIGERRLKQALKTIKLLGNLGAYPHSEGHTKAIIDRLTAALVDLHAKLSRTKTKDVDVTGVFDESDD